MKIFVVACCLLIFASFVRSEENQPLESELEDVAAALNEEEVDDVMARGEDDSSEDDAGDDDDEPTNDEEERELDEADEEESDKEEEDDEEEDRLARLLSDEQKRELQEADQFDGDELDGSSTSDVTLGKRSCNHYCIKIWKFKFNKCCPPNYCRGPICRKCGVSGHRCGFFNSLNKKCCPGFYCRGLPRTCQSCGKPGAGCNNSKIFKNKRPPCCAGSTCKFGKCRSCRQRGQRCSSIRNPCCPGQGRCRGWGRRRKCR